MSITRSTWRRAGFESLEQRQLLAGDVVVGVLGGNLTVRGDDADNHIQITGGAGAGSFLITGLNGTTVHLEGTSPAASATVGGVTRGARISLGGGDDAVALLDAAFRGSVTIQTGEGDDQVVVGGESTDPQKPSSAVRSEGASVIIRGSLGIETDGGNDRVRVDAAVVDGLLSIHTGADNDSVSLGSLVSVAGTVPIVRSSEAANAAGDGVTFRLSVRSGIVAQLGDGGDTLTMHHVSTRSSAFVGAGDGDDSVEISRSRVLSLTVLGDGGADRLTVNTLDASHLSFFAGDGNDHLAVLDSVFTSIAAVMGDGDDEVTIAGVDAKFAALFGGLGQDTLHKMGENDFRFDIVDGFELPVPLELQLGRWPGRKVRA